MQKITPFFWFETQAREAVALYVSLFKRSKVLAVSTLDGTPSGTVQSVRFTLDGSEFIAFNGGPAYTLSPAISLFVSCRTQRELDRLWRGLSRGGKALRCGWLTDRFGVTWQIVPDGLDRLLGDPDRAKAQRVMLAMLKMVKLDIAALRAAHGGKRR